MSQKTRRKKFAVTAAILGAIAVVLFSAYFAPAQKEITIKPATQQEQDSYHALGVAQRFVPTSPTFAFDGDINTLKTEYVGATKSIPPQHMIRATFESSHGGFGNREGQLLSQAITPHQIDILVSEGAVISAVTDQTWDELNHQYVLKSPKVSAGSETSFASFLEALGTNGATVEPVEEIADSMFSVPSKVISVNGEHVQIFEFQSTSEAQVASLTVSQDGTQIGNNSVRWTNTPHFYTNGKIIVLYVGQNSDVIILLESLLGKQFAGM